VILRSSYLSNSPII